jgi:hypothetical protein
MRRIISSSLGVALALVAVGGSATRAVRAAGVPPVGLVTPHFISDSFAGGVIDPNVWGWYGTSEPDHVTFRPGGGALVVSVAATAPNDFNASLGTRCKVRGDFDATLSFRLVQWPANNGVWVSLMAADTGGFNVYRVSWQFGSGEAYGGYLPPAGTAIDGSGNQGVLRLARQGSTWSAYFLSGRHWTPIVSGPGPGSDIALSPGVFNVSGATAFGSQATVVAFDSFHVSAARVVCP